MTIYHFKCVLGRGQFECTDHVETIARDELSARRKLVYLMFGQNIRLRKLTLVKVEVVK